jgi:hypothetical protein
MGTITKPYSFAGYSAPTWLAKNKEGLKAILVAVTGVATYFIAKIQPPELNAVIGGVAAAAVKFLIDAIDYWLTENAA